MAKKRGNQSTETNKGSRQGELPDESEASGNQQQSIDQGGHAGMGGHGGQQSGGMGGEHGGDVHDAGSAQSGMTGRGGMGGNDTGMQQAGGGSRQQAGEGDDKPIAEIQQSAQRQGMGQHRHGNRANEQALDATSDVDDLGSHRSGAATSREDGSQG